MIAQTGSQARHWRRCLLAKARKCRNRLPAVSRPIAWLQGWCDTHTRCQQEVCQARFGSRRPPKQYDQVLSPSHHCPCSLEFVFASRRGLCRFGVIIDRMAGVPRRPGRPPKPRTLRPTSVVWGTEAHYRLKRVLDSVVPQGDTDACPRVLYRDCLPVWPERGSPEHPGNHLCFGKPPHPPCAPCLERRRLVGEVATRWSLTRQGRPVQWATGWFSDALDCWQSHPEWPADHPLRIVIPVVTISDQPGSFAVSTAEEAMAAQRRDIERRGLCPRCGRSEPQGWHIHVPDRPRNPSRSAWEQWRTETVSIVNTIARAEKASLGAQQTSPGAGPYPPDNHLCVFGWYQVGGLTRAGAASQCGLSADASLVSRISREVAGSLGVTLRRGKGRPRKRE